MYETKTIAEQIDSYDNLTIAGFAMNDSNNATIISGDNVTKYMYNMYGQYVTISHLYQMWALYNATHYADFLKSYIAWTDSYNPLENYNSTEINAHMENDGKITTETTHGKTLTTTPTGVETVTSVTTYDDTSYRPENKIEQSGTIENAESGTTTVETDQDTKTLNINGTNYTADKVTGDILKKSGNIGVTTTQEMLRSEIDLRRCPVAMLYIDTFVNTYAYYVGSGDFGTISNFI